EQVVGLTEANVGLDASLVNPLDTELLSRLTQANIPALFPVLLRIEPPANGGLSFSGPVTIALHTHNLPYLPGTLLRIYGASLGEPFEDITEYVGSGSYRCRGTKGSFSEFLILTDLRPLSLAIREKIERLELTLEDNEAIIDPAVFSTLTTLAAQIRAAYEAGNKNLAIVRTDQFLAVVVANSGSAIPDVWRSSRDLVNAAGLLRAAGETLRFSLSLKTQLGLGIL
ncbi:MAG TPA: DUF6689 family protein, partial [Thermoanaerobaculia bacterium]